MKLDDYLARIAYDGPVEPDLACLAAIHRQHLLAIPYENLDVQLRRPVDLDPVRIFDKLVTRRRGGWCYEMNGLLSWALRELGFDVRRMVGGVMRAAIGDEAFGNHLVLRVELDEPYLVDVGLGDGILDPIPLREGEVEQAGRRFRLERLADGHWRFHNREGGIPPSFDISTEPDEVRLARTCQHLQDDETSHFRQNLICMRPDGERGTKVLIGRVLALPGREKRLLASAAELREVLGVDFGLPELDLGELWPRIEERHRQLFGEP